MEGQDGQHFAANSLGSGGGSGGSVQIITKNIAGTKATINLQGGNGSLYGGGGGSGGRLVTHFLKSFDADNVYEQSVNWSGTVLLEGGKGGLAQRTDVLYELQKRGE